MNYRHSLCLLSAALFLSAGLAQAEDSLRAEVGKPLQAAQELYKAQKYKEALAKVRDADAVSGKTGYESFTVERMRFAAANGAGEVEVAAKALDVLLASGKLAAAEQQKFIQAIAVGHYRTKDYVKAITWTLRYFKEGGSDAQMRTLLIQSYYLNNDFANAAKDLSADLQAEAKPGEDRLSMLATCYLRLNDHAGYLATLEKMVTHYPKKEYWADLLHRIQKKPGFSDRLALDVLRLKLATGQLNGTGDYMEMAQLALQQGFPAEAKKIVDEGYAKNLFGTGAEAARHQRLRDLVNKQLAEDRKNLAQGEAQASAAKEGAGLLNIGYNYVLNGQNDKGLLLMEQGMAKGGLKRLEDARLHLGQAYLLAGQKTKAVQFFKTVQGQDGTADLARLWILQGQ